MRGWVNMKFRFVAEDESKLPKPRAQPLDRDTKLTVLCLCAAIVIQAVLIMSDKPPVWWLWLPVIGIVSCLGWEIWRE